LQICLPELVLWEVRIRLDFEDLFCVALAVGSNKQQPFVGVQGLAERTIHNVLAQIENLKSHPSVHSRVTRGEVDIRGWVYDIGDGSIWAATHGQGPAHRSRAS